MYVVFTAVEMLPGTTEDGAVKDLKDQLIPQIKQAPGFVKGEWFGDDKHGHGFVVFETEDQAKQGLQEIGERLSWRSRSPGATCIGSTPKLDTGGPQRQAQCASSNAFCTAAEIRPRSDTSYPLLRAHSRTAVVCSRLAGPDLRVVVRPR